jgi:uncharacterized membrane protein YdbT with pleckstrin-like domain
MGRMSYSDELFQPGEKIRHAGRRHPRALVGALGVRVVQILLLRAVLRAARSAAVTKLLAEPFLVEVTGAPLPLAHGVGRLCFWLGAAVVVSAVFDVLRWRTAEYIVTDQRVLNVEGVLTKSTLDSPLDSIDDVLLVQSALGRLLDYGNLAIVRGAVDGGNRLPDLAHPVVFKKALMVARQQRVQSGPANGSEGAGAGRKHAPLDVQKALRDLAALRDEGIVSADDFEKKKKDLLARL